MARPQYGSEHQRARAKALDDLKAGEACGYCGHPMSRDMHLDFDHYPPLAIPLPDGLMRIRRLTHRACNRRAGQAISAARRSVRRARGSNSQPW